MDNAQSPVEHSDEARQQTDPTNTGSIYRHGSPTVTRRYTDDMRHETDPAYILGSTYRNGSPTVARRDTDEMRQETDPAYIGSINRDGFPTVTRRDTDEIRRDSTRLFDDRFRYSSVTGPGTPIQETEAGRGGTFMMDYVRRYRVVAVVVPLPIQETEEGRRGRYQVVAA